VSGRAHERSRARSHAQRNHNRKTLPPRKRIEPIETSNAWMVGDEIIPFGTARAADIERAIEPSRLTLDEGFDLMVNEIERLRPGEPSRRSSETDSEDA
jgi:hypothetical protein